jgi:hypothetical protein
MADQMFVIEQGLFDHLKGLILSPTKLSQTLQSMAGYRAPATCDPDVSFQLGFCIVVSELAGEIYI